MLLKYSLKSWQLCTWQKEFYRFLEPYFSLLYFCFSICMLDHFKISATIFLEHFLEHIFLEHIFFHPFLVLECCSSFCVFDQHFLSYFTYLSRCFHGMVQLRKVTCFRDSDFRADFSGLKHLMQTLRALEELRQKTANEKGTSTRCHGCFRPSAHFELWL